MARPNERGSPLGYSVRMQVTRPTTGTALLWPALIVAALAGCAGPLTDRVVYSDRGIRVGVQTDGTAGLGSASNVNSHPVRLMPEEVRKLLSPLQVSGYAGTVVGQFISAQPLPVFSEEELGLIAAPIATAFSQAKPRERVFFSIPNLAAPFRPERTEGALFFRGPYLHFLLTDHSAFTKTDQAGGDDPRDTKGMRLYVSGPWKAAAPPSSEIPHWGPYERVTIALDARQMLASTVPVAAQADQLLRQLPPIPAARQPAPAESSDALRQQVRDLTTSNQELQKRLGDQEQEVEALKKELERIKADLRKPAPKNPPRRKPQAQ